MAVCMCVEVAYTYMHVHVYIHVCVYTCMYVFVCAMCLVTLSPLHVLVLLAYLLFICLNPDKCLSLQDIFSDSQD